MNKDTIRKTLLLSLLIIIWAASWSINKLALDYTPPLLFAGLRAMLGGILLSLFLISTWKKINWRNNWKKYCVSAVLNVAIFFGVQTIGLLYLPGGLFSVLVYFQPVLVGLLAWIWLGENMTIRKSLGLLVGFLGILVIGAESFTGSISLLGVTLALITAISWAFGVVYIKKIGNTIDSMWMVAFQSFIGGLILLVFGSIFEQWGDIVPSWPYFTGLVFGMTLGLPISFVIYYSLVNAGEASKVASFTFLVPVLAVIIGTIFLQEPVTVYLLVGLVCIVGGITVVNYTGHRRNKVSGHESSPKAKAQ